MKYHAMLTANNGLNTPSTNPCKLLDFGLLKLGVGEIYSGESGGREMLAVLLGGRASFEIGEKRFEKVGGDRTAERARRSGSRAVCDRTGESGKRHLGRGQLQALLSSDFDPCFLARFARAALDRR